MIHIEDWSATNIEMYIIKACVITTTKLSVCGALCKSIVCFVFFSPCTR
uniref:Uncharacterized protein n=1 Tax=Anguilla anguilla TaxID=7936 RepID=A0A0E9W4M8_ANGAN